MNIFNIAMVFISAGFVFIEILILIKSFYREKTKSNINMLLMLLFFFFAILFEELSYVLLDIHISRLVCLMYILIAIFTLNFVDYTTRETLDVKKVIFVAVLSTCLIANLLNPNSIIIDMSITLSPATTFFLQSLNIFSGIMLIYLVANIYLKSPKSLKRESLRLLIGVFFFTLLSTVLFLLTYSTSIQGIHVVVQAIGIIITGSVWRKDPKLAFILPFKAYKLTVFNTSSGIQYFDYYWNKDSNLVSEILYSGMLQGVSLIINESVKKGNIREIKMDEAVIILNHSKKYAVASVLLTSKSSKYLSNSLLEFSKEFELKYEKLLNREGLVAQIDDIEDLIEKWFSNIPKF